MKNDLHSIFRPRSIAVIGASRQAGSIGREILYNLVSYDFQGKVYPVNPRAEVIHSMKCYKSVLEIPDPVDLAIVAVPASAVEPVLEECGRKGVQGLVVITAGFKETGASGRSAEARLLEVCSRHGMRMIGPNCMGIVNTDPRYRVNGTFAPSRPLAGRIAFLSQSGALGVAILNIAQRTGLGVSMFASIGNKTDVSGSDLVQYWAEDRRTDIILMYLESFGDPIVFTRLAREVSRKKPIVVVKSGRTEAGARAAAGHTGALAGRDASIQALCDQCGLIRVNSIEELFDVGKALATQPLPKGDRVAIVTNAGGPAIMATDDLISAGFEMASFSSVTIDRLESVLPAEASLSNPVDMIASAGVEEYGTTLAAVLDDLGVDAAIVIFVPPMMVDPIRISRRIFREAATRQKPVLGVFMAEEKVLEDILALKEDQIPIYRFPEATADVLAALRRRRQWLDRPPGQEVRFEVDHTRARALVDGARARGEVWLTAEDSFELLSCYGIPVTAPSTFGTVDPVPEPTTYPVVLKATGGGIVHKSEVGGVRSGIDDLEELKAARDTMVASVGSHDVDLEKVQLLVQEEIPPGRELIFGTTADHTSGPLLMFGLGGIYVEVFEDVVFRNHPITDQDAKEMVRGLRGHALLQGVRGEPPVDFALLEDVMLRLNHLVDDLAPCLETLEMNPFIAHSQGGTAVDCRVRLKPC